MAAVPPKTHTPSTAHRAPSSTPAKGFKNSLVSPPSTGKVATTTPGPASYKPKAPQKSQGAGMKKGGC